ncbi:SRPBCC family protein [Gemmata sp. SH-PL17]|uniref:SRPBCC family protein n=1 Tax=Gemmata sp. SH-PL17 TaxID=1630693 RepID=UPI0039656A48
MVSTRLIEAPQERVFQAFANPDQLKHWWGPNGFVNTIEKFELYPGGAWRLIMHGPDGTDYHNESVFTEVTVPERVAFEHREPVHRFTMQMTFTPVGAHTQLTWRMVFESATEFAKIKDFVIPANEQNFDRLAAHLAAL